MSKPDGSHDWRWDEVSQVYRCWDCLVRGDKPHGPVCPKGPKASEREKGTPA